jgi:hypothetical protein
MWLALGLGSAAQSESKLRASSARTSQNVDGGEEGRRLPLFKKDCILIKESVSDSRLKIMVE